MSGLAVLLNPRAGSGRAGRVWRHLRSAEPRVQQAQLVESADPQQAADELARAAARGVDRVVVLGGDGSVHLAANVLFRADLTERVAVGIVPVGTGSDFAKTLGVPRKSIAALRRCLEAEPRSIDVLCVETDDGRTERVVNVFSAGISGLVDEAVHALPRRNALMYLTGALSAVFRYTPARCRVLVDGELWHEGEILLVAVANATTFGNGMRIAPHARIDDGVADIVLARAVAGWTLPFRLPRLYLGTHLGLPFIRSGTGRSVRVEPLGSVPAYDVDGEVFEPAPATVTVQPRALRIL